MRKIFFLCLCIFAYSDFSAQFASVSLKEEMIRKIGEVSKNATLVLAINNEKDPTDAALINAVKAYWKHGKYKLISRAEFFSKQKNKELPKSDLYLYEASELFANAYSAENPALLANAKGGVFYLSLGEAETKISKMSGVRIESTGSIHLKFDLSGTMSNSKDKINEGYFNLMIKYFNNEVAFCQKYTSPKDIVKIEKDGVVYFKGAENEIKNRDILLVKEQVNKTKPTDKKKTVTPSDAVAQFNPELKNVYTVYPEDVKLATTKGDKKVLLFSNDMLINALDGSVMAAYASGEDEGSKKDPGFWAAALGIFGSALLIALIL